MPTGAFGSPALRCPHAPAIQPARPHLIVFMADDLGLLDTSYAGSTIVATPHLDALVSHSTVLSRFRAPTWCAPSRASFLTGRHGWEVGVSAALETALGRDSLLLPSLLRELGYRTAVVGKLHLNPKTCSRFRTGGRFGCGFDAQYGFIGGMTDYYKHHASWSRDGQTLREKGYATDLFAAEAERLVHGHAASHANRSLFLWLSLNAPHTPMQAPEEWISKQSSSLDSTTRIYAAMIGAMDDAFGRTVNALKVEQMLANSLVFFSSDNGGPICSPVCNGGLRGGKGTPYEGSVHRTKRRSEVFFLLPTPPPLAQSLPRARPRARAPKQDLPSLTPRFDSSLLWPRSGMRAAAFLYWPPCLGPVRRESHLSAHMVDVFATLVVAASSGQPDAQVQRVHRLLRKKAPHSVSLWEGIAATVAGRAVPPELSRRQLVLQVSASSSALVRGRWKLVLAATRCFGQDPKVSHHASMRGFPADRWLLWRLAEHLGGNSSGGSSSIRRFGAQRPSAAARLLAARAAGADLQLFDLHADPAEMHNLLRHEPRIAPAAIGGGLHRMRSNETSIASALLGHYLAAVRIGQRNIQRAYAEARLRKGSVMVVWFCRQVDKSGTLARWEPEQRSMCQGRSERERWQLSTVPAREKPTRGPRFHMG
jgi:arylsulfatase A-like enzyme